MLEKKFTKLEDSIIIIYMLEGLINKYLKVLETEKNNKNSIVFAAVSSQILIIACSFLEEWDLLGGLSDTDIRIIKVRKIAAPAFDRINHWKDLKNVRNTILAHNLRTKKNGQENVLMRENMTYAIPTSYFDHALLSYCISMAKSILFKYFKKECRIITSKLDNIVEPGFSISISNQASLDKECEHISNSMKLLENDKI
jgi:hypothetical protein